MPGFETEQQLRAAKSSSDIVWVVRDLLSDLLHGSTIQIWIARVLIISIAVWLVVWVFKKTIELIAGIVESWKKAGLPVPCLSPEQKEVVQQRKRFCVTVASDLDQLNKSENWNDQQFTDLEAEVEADGWYYASRFDRIIRRRSHGQRRVPSLMKAIETSVERRLLLVGEPGSGKSVALRHLAHEFAERGKKSTDLDAKIPLYVNLKELPPPPDAGPSVGWIKSFVIENVRRGDADTAQYVRDHWDQHMNRGLWLFLFDSFDEIPAVMHAPDESGAIQSHAEAIRQFLDGAGNCLGVLASREFKGPQHLAWEKFRILALTDRKQEEFVGNWYLQQSRREIVERHLAASPGLTYRNPLFLALLCRHVKEQGQPPPSDHDLLYGHLVRLAGRDAERTLARYRLTPDDLMSGATQLAILFARDATLSLAPTYDEVAAAMPPGVFSAERIGTLLDALVDVKLGRSDVKETRQGDRRFTFAHRRYQEVLFVRHLATHGGEIEPRELLLDHRWREYAVALLQTESAAVRMPLVNAAIALLRDWSGKQVPVAGPTGFGAQATFFEWPGDREIWLLSLLQEGLCRRLAEVPAELRDAVGALLRPRWEGGDTLDRTNVLMYGLLLPEKQLGEFVTSAVMDGSSAQRGAAFSAMAYLSEVPYPHASWLCHRLSREILLAPGKQDLLALEATVSRLPDYVGAAHVYRRCLRLRRLLPLPRGRLRRLFPDRGKMAILASIPASLILVVGFNLAFLKIPASSGGSVIYRIRLPALVLLGILGSLFAFIVFTFAVRDVRWKITPPRLLAILKTNALRDLMFAAASMLLLVAAFEALLYFMKAASLNFVSRLNRWTSWLDVALNVAIIFAIAFDAFALCSAAFEGWKSRRHARRLKQRLAMLAARTLALAQVPLDAESLEELEAWLSAPSQALLLDRLHARGLGKTLLTGKTQPRLLPESPLASHMLARHPNAKIGAALTLIESRLSVPTQP
jgi:hypothetical protein